MEGICQSDAFAKHFLPKQLHQQTSVFVHIRDKSGRYSSNNKQTIQTNKLYKQNITNYTNKMINYRNKLKTVRESGNPMLMHNFLPIQLHQQPSVIADIKIDNKLHFFYEFAERILLWQYFPS